MDHEDRDRRRSPSELSHERPCRRLPHTRGALRRLTRWLGRSQFVEAVASTGDQFLLSASIFLATVLLAKACTRPVFGAFGITKTLLVLVDLVRRTLVELPVMVFVPALTPRQKRANFGAAAVLEAGLALVFCAAMAAGVGVMAAAGIPPYVLSAMAALAAASLFIAGREFVRACLYSLHRPRTALLVDGVARGLLAAAVLALYFGGVLSPVTAWLTVGVADGFGLLVGWRFVPCAVARGLKRLRETAASFWRFGRWMAGSYAFAWLARMFPAVVLGMLYGSGAPAGIFAALSITSPLTLVATPFNNVFVARGSQVLSQAGPRALARYLAVRRIALLSLVAVIALPLALFARPLLHLLYGGKYDAADWIVRLLAAQLFLFSIVRTLSIGLVCLRRARLHFGVHAATGLASAVAVLPLVTLYREAGCVGLVVGIEVLYCVLFWAAYRLAIRESSASWDESAAA